MKTSLLALAALTFLPSSSFADSINDPPAQGSAQAVVEQAGREAVNNVEGRKKKSLWGRVKDAASNLDANDVAKAAKGFDAANTAVQSTSKVVEFCSKGGKLPAYCKSVLNEVGKASVKQGLNLLDRAAKPKHEELPQHQDMDYCHDLTDSTEQFNICQELPVQHDFACGVPLERGVYFVRNGDNICEDRSDKIDAHPMVMKKPATGEGMQTFEKPKDVKDAK